MEDELNEIQTEQEQQIDRFSMTFSLPRALMPIPILSFTEKLIIARIVSLSHRYTNQGCTLSNSSLAEAHGCSGKAVSVAISKAIWLGFLVSREDELEEYRNKRGNTVISQVRKLKMYIPDVWLYFGEIWADFYFTGDRGAKLILDWIKEYVKNEFTGKFSEKNKLDIKKLHDNLVELLSQEQNKSNTFLKKYRRPLEKIPDTPPQNSGDPLEENVSLFMFTYFKFTNSGLKSKSFVQKNGNDNDSKPLEHPLEDTHTEDQKSVGKPPEKPKELIAFERFWDAFEDKKGKASALKSWKKIPDLDDGLIEKIIDGAKRYAKERQKLLTKGLIPKMAQGWLTDRRWEDELPEGEFVKNFGYIKIEGEKRGHYKNGFYVPTYNEIPKGRWEEYLNTIDSTPK